MQGRLEFAEELDATLVGSQVIEEQRQFFSRNPFTDAGQQLHG